MSAKIYYDKDCDPKSLEGLTIAVIGYGSQGHAQAQNLRDSGFNVIIGANPNGKSWERAKNDNFEVFTAEEAAKRADVIQLLVPDTMQPELYKQSIEPHLKEGNSLVFSHGFNIHYEEIIPPNYVDVFMIAPKGPGRLVRKMYEEGKGVPALIAIHQDYTGKAKDKALAYAMGIGAGRAGIIETTFREETETDLFGEQVVLCGGLTSLIMAGFETLIEAGYQPEVAYFECLHEAKLIMDLIYEGGIYYMRQAISDTAKYGDMTRGPRIINKQVREEMKKILDEIQKDKGAKFAKEWIEENKKGRPNFNRMLEESKKHPIEEVGKKLRGMMSWLKEK